MRAPGTQRASCPVSPRPVLLDLFCGAGGASSGYAQVGFDVVGVDIVSQPSYPYRFVQADVTTLDLAALVKDLGAVAMHASPPCQLFSPLAAYDRGKIVGKYADLVDWSRAALSETGLPYVIENVPGSPLHEPTLLCGTMFPRLKVIRHRLFETQGFTLTAREHPSRDLHPRCARNGNLPLPDQFMTITGGKHSRAWQRKACESMGVPWMAVPIDASVERTKRGVRELCESIPPAFTSYVGGQMLAGVQPLTRLERGLG